MHQYKATIYNVVDGDTVDVNVDLGFKIFTKQRLRIIGIDTPERGQPGYTEAVTFAKETLLNKEIKLTTFKVSKWGYYLASIELENNVDFGELIIQKGLAKFYDGGKKE
jgi:micrococcal nuclease